MKKWLFIITLLLVAFCCSMVYAHPGRTDYKGGHYDRSTGEYHYHHGYPAHQHENGVCPYDFDDNTQYSESKSVSDVSVPPDAPILSFLSEYNIFAVISISFICCFTICVFIYYIYTSNHTSTNNDISEEDSISNKHKILWIVFWAFYLEYNFLIFVFGWMEDVVFKVLVIGWILALLSMLVWVLEIFSVFNKDLIKKISQFFAYAGFVIFFLSIIPILLASFLNR